MSFLKIYNKSPKAIQNVMLSMKSRLYQKHRRGSQYNKYFQDFMRMQWLDTEGLSNLQRALFHETFSEAYQYVTYYRSVFDALKFTPTDYRTIDDLSFLPIIEKETLRDSSPEFENQFRKTVYISKTGGTTGAPMTTPWDSDSMQYSIAIQDHYFQTVGVRYGLPCLYLTGQGIVPNTEKKSFTRLDYATNSIFPSVHHLSKDTISKYLEDIQLFKPVWGMGYTSFAYEMACHIIDLDRCGEIVLGGFMGTSETAEPEMVRAIEKAFGTKFHDFYSSTEGIPFMGQCSAGNYHLHPASGIIEFLNEEGKKALIGEPARMVMTSFKNKKKPLLRYAIDDYAVLRKDQKCACGSNWQMIESICGRRAEWVTNNMGKRISQFSHQVFKVINYVKSSQILQMDTDEFVLRLVVDNKNRSDVERKLTSRIPEILGHKADITFEYYESIPRSGAGKRPTVISRI